MVRAVEKVRERLLRATDALDTAGVPYAEAGGNAVAAWVSRVDETAVRNTRDVDIILRRDDLAAATTALEMAGFVPRHSAGLEMFLDGPQASAPHALHVIFAREKVRSEHILAAPDVGESELADRFRIVTLEALVRMKLTAFRDKDRTHLRDLIDVGLVDESWRERLPADLFSRLQSILETPDG
jgi:hypothetical protein